MRMVIFERPRELMLTRDRRKGDGRCSDALSVKRYLCTAGCALYIDDDLAELLMDLELFLSFCPA